MFERRKIKVRGIEARRRDTPEFIREVQIEMLRELAKAWNTKTFKARIPAVIEILKQKAARLIRGEVDPVTKQLKEVEAVLAL